jgi:hypothetical protein
MREKTSKGEIIPQMPANRSQKVFLELNKIYAQNSLELRRFKILHSLQ